MLYRLHLFDRIANTNDNSEKSIQNILIPEYKNAQSLFKYDMCVAILYLRKKKIIDSISICHQTSSPQK